MRSTTQDPFEAEAVRIVGEWVGKQGTVTPVGGHGEDFRVQYTDGRVGIGEVKRVTEEAYQQMWRALLKMSPPQSLPLEPGLGTWAASISVNTPLNKLAPQLAEIAGALLEMGVTDAQIDDYWPCGDVYDHLRNLQITRFWTHTGTGPGTVWLFPKGVGGQLPLSAEQLVPWIEQYLVGDKQSLRNSLARLQGSCAEERHLFLWLEDGLPDSLTLFLSFHPDQPPQSPPSLPEYLTHLWVGIVNSFTDERWIWLGSRDGDWVARSTTR